MVKNRAEIKRKLVFMLMLSFVVVGLWYSVLGCSGNKHKPREKRSKPNKPEEQVKKNKNSGKTTTGWGRAKSSKDTKSSLYTKSSKDKKPTLTAAENIKIDEQLILTYSDNKLMQDKMPR